MVEKVKKEKGIRKNERKFYSSDILCPKNHEEVANPYWKMPESEHMFRLKYCPYCGKEIFISNKEKYFGLKGEDNESPDC